MTNIIKYIHRWVKWTKCRQFCYELGLVIICAKIFSFPPSFFSVYVLLLIQIFFPPLFILTKYLSLHLSALWACGVHDLFMERASTLASVFLCVYFCNRSFLISLTVVAFCRVLRGEHWTVIFINWYFSAKTYILFHLFSLH